jgi:hypothetical protein
LLRKTGVTMKKSIVIFALGLLLAVTVNAQKTSSQKAANTPKTANAQKSNDVEAIKALIERETKAYFNIDYKTWTESWVHSPSALWSFADSTGITTYEGWKAIEIGFTDYFVTSKPDYRTNIERTWQEVKVYGNGAYARFKQYVVTNGVRGPEQLEIRILEKDQNQWKILLVGVLKKS